MPCSSRGLKAIDSSTEPDPAFLGCAFFSLSLIHPGYNRYSVRLSHAIKERVRGHSLTTQTLHMTFTTQRLKKSRHEELGLVSFWIVWDRIGWGQTDKMTKPHDPLLDPVTECVCRGGVKGSCLSLSLPTDWQLQVWGDLCYSSSSPELVHLCFHSPASLSSPHSSPVCFLGGEFTEFSCYNRYPIQFPKTTDTALNCTTEKHSEWNYICILSLLYTLEW